MRRQRMRNHDDALRRDVGNAQRALEATRDADGLFAQPYAPMCRLKNSRTRGYATARFFAFASEWPSSSKRR